MTLLFCIGTAQLAWLPVMLRRQGVSASRIRQPWFSALKSGWPDHEHGLLSLAMFIPAPGIAALAGIAASAIRATLPAPVNLPLIAAMAATLWTL